MADNNKDQLLASLSEILNIDQELARYYLEETRWSVEAAIGKFYADTGDELDDPVEISKPPLYVESEEETSGSSQRDSPTSESSNLKLLCWNLDGLDEKNLEERTDAVLQSIRVKKPDVVLLQEVVPYSLNVFQKSCEGYAVLFGDYTVPYFNAILLRKSSVQTNESAVQFVAFQTSVMGRHYLIQPIKFADAKIILMTSHLESLWQNAAERKNQLKEVLDYMKRQNPNFNIVFGGDTNLRDSEVNAIGGLPNDVRDAWESCGSPPTAKYTWDTSENDNLDNAKAKKSKLRFDRIFIRAAKDSKKLVPSGITLVGKERLARCRRFASDHWAIWLEMNIQ